LAGQPNQEDGEPEGGDENHEDCEAHDDVRVGGCARATVAILDPLSVSGWVPKDPSSAQP
jgi:hypothetical protein